MTEGPRPLDLPAKVLAWLVVAAAALTMVSWFAGGFRAVQLAPGMVPIQFNTALGLLLAGASLLLAMRGNRTWARALAGACGLLVSATFAQYLAGVDLGLDQLFLKPGIADRTVTPGRMAPATAFALLLSAIAIVMMTLRTRQPFPAFWIQALAGVSVAAAVQALLEQLATGAPAGTVTLTEIAPQTVALILALNAPIILVTPTSGPKDDAQRVERYAAWSAMLLAGLAFVMWQNLERREWRERARDTSLATAAFTQSLTSRLSIRGSALQRFAERWSIYGAPTQAQWEQEARLILRDFPELIAVVYADADYIIRWRVARDGRQQLIGTSLGTDDGRIDVYRDAERRKTVRLTPAIDLRSGGLGIAYVVPVHANEKLVGYFTTSVRADEILASTGDLALADFGVSVRDGHALLAGQERPASLPAFVPQEVAQFDALGQPWTVTVWPQQSYLKRTRSLLPLAIMLMGLLASALVGAAFVQARRGIVNRQHARMLSERLEGTLESISDGFYTLDRDWRFVFVNTEMERLVLRKRHEMIGRVIWDVFEGLEGSAFQRNYERALSECVTVSFEEYYPLLGKWFEVRAYPSADGLAVYFRDVSERKVLVEQLRRSQQLESLGQLTGGVAHDFNNLLTVILGNADVLSEQLAGQPRLKALADMMAGAAQRGAGLTQRLLAFARKQALEPKVVDINRLVADMDAMLRRTLGEHIQIEFTRGAGLWPALIDPAQLDNALLNLCLNARDAMPEGGRLTIETANMYLSQTYADRYSEVQPGQYVMLAVTDSGCGISAEHMERVFEPFFTTKEPGKGTGLGLAMIYGFVKQSGGHVNIYSEPGQGTTVKLYLPRAPIDAAAEDLARASAPVAGGLEAVLLVEDDELVRRFAHDQLVSLGYQVMQAGNGAQALEIIGSDAPIDLLFTDVVMPGMSGRELADAALKLRPGLKVLYTSGYTDNAIVHHGRLDPGAHLLSKPYRRDELARKLRLVLGAG